MKKILSFALILVLSLSFTAFASDFSMISSSVDDGATVVYTKEGTITLGFNAAVGTVAVSVKKDNAVFNDYLASINVIDSTKIDIAFDADLAYGSTYVIDFAETKDESDVAVSGKTSISFKVESAPEVEVSSVELISGINSGSTITVPTDLVANGSLQGWTINVTNNAAEAKNITIFCGIYDVNGTLKKVVSSEKTVAAESSDSIGLGTVIPTASDAGVSFSGGFAKLFVWNNVNDKSPYVAAQTFDIQ